MMTRKESFSASLASWQSEGRFFLWKDQRIFTQCAGRTDNEALLLIHGFPTASWDWEAIWPTLAGHYRLLTLDMMGFGFSDKPRPYPYSIFDQADLFEDFLREQKIVSAHVLAHDYGDTVAQELLARHNEGRLSFELNSVCLLNGGLFPETHHPLLVQKLLLSPLGPLAAKLITRRGMAASMRKIFGAATQPSDALLDAFWQLLDHKHGRAIMPLLIRYMEERRQHRQRWVGALQQSQVPLRLINGLADPISGAHMVRRYRELVHGADVVELEGVGHYPQVEAADEVVRAVQEFLARV
ncbi:MAG: alpha/beta hydrolase [Pedobacter sp.]|nr:alpha/beta hydrolase [Pedobacter sp.]